MLKLKKCSIFFIATAILLVTVLSACSRQPAATNDATPNVQVNTPAPVPVKTEMVYSSTINILALDPQMGNKGEQAIDRAIFNGLLDTEPGTHVLKPGLAEKYEGSADNKTFTFHLRKGVKFQKGFGELKASDVIFTFKRLMDPKNAFPASVNMKIIDTITAPDDYTVVFKLKKSDSAFPYLMSDAFQGSYIFSEKAVTQFGDKTSLNPIGTGPYQLEELIPSSKVVLVANPDYYKGAPKMKKFTYLGIQDDTTAFLAYQKGEIDAMYTQSPDVLDKAKTLSDTVIQKAANYGVSTLFMNIKEKPFDDLKVRQALAYAIDINAAVQTAFGNVNTVAKGYVPASAKEFTSDGVMQYPHNPDKAKQLLAEAGYPNGFTVNTKQMNSPSNVRLFTMFQSQLAKVGIKLDFDSVVSREWLSFQSSGTAKLGWYPGGSIPIINYLLYNQYHSDNFPKQGSNTAFYKGIDDLLNKASIEPDEKVRLDLYKQAQVKLSQDLPNIPLYESNTTILTKKNLKGIVPGGDVSLDVRFENAHWE